MNETLNKLLLVGDKLMPEIHLRKPVLISSSAFRPLTKNEERIKKSKLDKPCFQYDMAFGDFKDLSLISVSDKASLGLS